MESASNQLPNTRKRRSPQYQENPDTRIDQPDPNARPEHVAQSQQGDQHHVQLDSTNHLRPDTGCGPHPGHAAHRMLEPGTRTGPNHSDPDPRPRRGPPPPPHQPQPLTPRNTRPPESPRNQTMPGSQNLLRPQQYHPSNPKTRQPRAPTPRLRQPGTAPSRPQHSRPKLHSPPRQPQRLRCRTYLPCDPPPNS